MGQTTQAGLVQLAGEYKEFHARDFGADRFARAVARLLGRCWKAMRDTAERPGRSVPYC
jgi:hypothetical protein